MNVLIVTGIFPPDHGGPASYVPTIATELTKLGHNVIQVITLSDTLEHPHQYPFPVLRLARNQSRLLRMIKTIRAVHSFAKNADVVYVNGLVLESVIATKILCKRPFVVKVVGDLIWERASQQEFSNVNLDDFQTLKLPLKWRALRKLQAWYIDQADNIIVPSNYLAKIVSGWGVSAKKITTILNAVQLHSLDTPATPIADVVTVARLVPWKGLDILIDVCARNHWQLNIVGDGPDRATLEALANKLSAQVTFVGHVSKSQVSHEIRKAKVFVLNSSYEGLPHVVLEAKAANVPVVATAVGGTPDTITHGIDGWLVKFGDKSELATTIEMVLSDEELRKVTVKVAKANAERKFSFTEMITKTTQTLISVSGKK